MKHYTGFRLADRAGRCPTGRFSKCILLVNDRLSPGQRSGTDGSHWNREFWSGSLYRIGPVPSGRARGRQAGLSWSSATANGIAGRSRSHWLELVIWNSVHRAGSDRQCNLRPRPRRVGKRKARSAWRGTLCIHRTARRPCGVDSLCRRHALRGNLCIGSLPRQPYGGSAWRIAA